MAKKKSKKKTSLSPSMFKVTGAQAKMKTVSSKEKLYYFKPKLDPKDAEKIASSNAADVLEVSSEIKIGKPSIKHDFYCIYDAELDINFLRARSQDIGVAEQVKGALVGKDVYTAKKKGNFHSIKLNMVELLEIKSTDGMILDGKTGGPAHALEKVLKSPGKKTASSAWLKKNSVSPGKFNNLQKVVRAVSKMAGKKPSGAKRIVSHTLTFKKLEGYYVPVYYVKISAGAKGKTLRINAIDGTLSLVM